MQKMKQFVVVALVLVLLLSAVPAVGTASASSPSEWDGVTVTQPTKLTAIDGVYYYEISTAEELAFLSTADVSWSDYNYILTNDIVLNSQTLTADSNGNLTIDPTGLNIWTSIPMLYGTFNGNGHKISGLYGSNGLVLKSYGPITNLDLENVYIKNTSGKQAVGGISAYSYNSYNKNPAQITNCTVRGTIVGTVRIGGICGEYTSEGPLTNCTNYATVIGLDGNRGTGGIVGALMHSWPDFWENRNYGTVSGTNYVGGILGNADGGNQGPSNCINYGTIQGNRYVGGISGSGSAYNSENYGAISGEERVGGIAGWMDYGSNCTNYGSVHGTSYVGGIMGGVSWRCNNVVNRGTVTGEAYVGGIAGTLSPSYASQKFVNTASVAGTDHVGGLAGISSGEISEGYVLGNVMGATLTGAIYGESKAIWGTGSVKNCYYLKTDTVNPALSAFGNAEDLSGGTSAKDFNFFKQTLTLPESMLNFKETATYTTGMFGDVVRNSWYEANTARAYELGLMKGTGEAAFSPTKNITIAEVVTMAARIHSIYQTGTADFVQGGTWYQVYVDYAIENGIIGPNSYSNYNALATRAMCAAILGAAVPESELQAINNITAIPDVTKDSGWGRAVYRLYNAGVLTGTDASGTFAPANKITRAEVATIATRIVDASLRKSYSIP